MGLELEPSAARAGMQPHIEHSSDTILHQHANDIGPGTVVSPVSLTSSEVTVVIATSLLEEPGIAFATKLIGVVDLFRDFHIENIQTISILITSFLISDSSSKTIQNTKLKSRQT